MIQYVPRAEANWQSQEGDMAECPACQHLTDDLTLLWDGRSYCRNCIGASNTPLHVAAHKRSSLDCTIRREDLSYWRSMRMLTIGSVALLVVVFAIPVAVTIARGEWNNVQLALVAFAILLSLMLGLLGLGMWVRMSTSRRQLPRVIHVADGEVTISTPLNTHRVMLANCDWVISKSSYDDVVAMFLPNQPAIMLLTDHGRFTVTNDPSEVELWRAFLTLSRPQERTPLGCQATGTLVLVSLLGGALVGALVGVSLRLVWPQPFIVLSLTLLGASDGIVISGVFASSRHYGKTLRQDHSLAVLFLALLVTGLQLTAGGWEFRGPIVVINALLASLLLHLIVYQPLSNETQPIAMSQPYSPSGPDESLVR